MGQQQLILLVLATVIVGLAIVVGIQAFNQNNLQSNSDAMVQDLVRLANDAQAWKTTPQAMGGQDDTKKGTLVDFTGADLGALGYPDPYCNLNACYTVTASATDLVIDATTVGSEGTFASLTTANTAKATVKGITDSDITTTKVIGAY